MANIMEEQNAVLSQSHLTIGALIFLSRLDSTITSSVFILILISILSRSANEILLINGFNGNKYVIS